MTMLSSFFSQLLDKNGRNCFGLFTVHPDQQLTSQPTKNTKFLTLPMLHYVHNMTKGAVKTTT